MAACAMSDAGDDGRCARAASGGEAAVKTAPSGRASRRSEGEIRWKTPELAPEEPRDLARDRLEGQTCSTSDDSRPCSRAEGMKGSAASEGGENSAAAASALDRARARFSKEAGEGDGELMRQKLNAMGQRELQALFVEMFDKVTTSNNNQWLRRRISAGLGLEDAAEQTVSSHVKAYDRPSKRLSARRSVVDAVRACGYASVSREAAVAPAQEKSPTSVEAVEYTPEGIRKSRRAIKPKTIFDSDAFPSVAKVSEERRKERKKLEFQERTEALANQGVSEHHGGKSGVGRRIRVYWPLEGQFFAGVISAYNPRTGLHHINYDDGDEEEILLATPEDSAPKPIEHPMFASPSEDADMADWPALKKGTKFAQKPLPQPSSNATRGLSENWCQVGKFVWGRVRGHGWWPGYVDEVDKAHNTYHVSFFDNSTARVHYHDLVSFPFYYPELTSSKKSKVFADAVSLAEKAYEAQRRALMKRRSQRDERAVIAEPAEPPRIWHFERETTRRPQLNKRSKDIVELEIIPELAVKRVKPAEPIVFSALQPMKTLQDLSKSLDAMKSKVLPIARESLEFINKHLAETAKVKPENEERSLIAADERVVMLDELASIESLIAWSENGTAKMPAPVAVPDLSFMTGGWSPSSADFSPSRSKKLLRQASQELLGGELDEIQWSVDTLMQPVEFDPACDGDGAKAPSTPEQSGGHANTYFQKSDKMSDSCETIHASFEGKKLNSPCKATLAGASA